MDEPDPYFLGYRHAEQERLERQARELAAESAALFDRIGVTAGWRVVEIGCGPEGCLGLLAERVGAAGRVTGIERNAEQVDSARRFLAANGLANVEVWCGDGRATGLPAGSFDLATARLVLVNVPEAQQIVDEMARLTRPGGVVALHEAVASTQRVDPPHPAQDRLVELLASVAARQGIDRNVALRAPRMLRAAGVTQVEVVPLVHVYPPGHDRRRLVLDFVENARARIVEDGLASESELNDLTAALRSHLGRPGNARGLLALPPGLGAEIGPVDARGAAGARENRRCDARLPRLEAAAQAPSTATPEPRRVANPRSVPRANVQDFCTSL